MERPSSQFSSSRVTAVVLAYSKEQRAQPAPSTQTIRFYSLLGYCRIPRFRALMLLPRGMTAKRLKIDSLSTLFHDSVVNYSEVNLSPPAGMHLVSRKIMTSKSYSR